MTIRPTKDMLFCKPAEAETQTKSGFILAASAAEKPKIAEVINIGEGVKGIQQRDRIVYKSYATSDIKLEGVEYFLISQEDVLGVVVD
jgi:chaperonin GroES